MDGMPEQAVWFNWLLLALATPVQFYVGGSITSGAFKALRSGSANMDVLIAMGSSAAYFYSLPVAVRAVCPATSILRRPRSSSH